MIRPARGTPAHGVAAMLLACLLVSGCVGDRDWHAPRPLAPGDLSTQQTLSGATVDETAWPQQQWWQVYGDPQLDALMTEALAGSPSLQIAEARLRQAQAEATRASAPLLPSTVASAQGTRQRFSENYIYPAPLAGNYYNDGRLALDFSYDLDFWGRNRLALEAARANVRAAEADHAAARLALTVGVARAYFNLNLQFALQQIARDSLVQQQAILDLTRQRSARGLENLSRVKEQEANVALTRAGLNYTDTTIKLVQTQLGTLVGKGPDRGLSLQTPHLMLSTGGIRLPSALPADLLGRRPDVVAQRWRVESATRGVASAEASFYPNVNLVAFAGFQAIGLSSLLNGGSAIVGAGPAVSLPIFNRRELRGALQAQQAQYDLSVAQYNQAVLEAVNDVASVVTNWDAVAGEAADAQIAEDAAQHAYAISKDRYRAGLDNYLSVLNSQNEVLLTQAVLAELLSRQLNFTVDLVRSLGGGYLSPAVPPAGATPNGS